MDISPDQANVCEESQSCIQYLGCPGRGILLQIQTTIKLWGEVGNASKLIKSSWMVWLHRRISEQHRKPASNKKIDIGSQNSSFGCYASIMTIQSGLNG